MYINKKLPNKAICEQLGISGAVLSYQLSKYQIPKRYANRNSTQRKPCLDIDKLKLLATDISLSNKDIAESFGVSISKISNWFLEHNISRAFKNNENKRPSKEILQSHYANERLSPADIGKLYGVSHATVGKWLVEYKIKTRTRSETQELAAQKIIAGNLEKFGVRSNFELEESKIKTKATYQRKYGVDYPSQVPEIRQKTKDTNLKLYGFENTFGLVSSPSKGETDLINALNQKGFNLISTRSVLKDGFELDGYDAEKKIAVEYCGLYWHSEKAGKTQKYHYSKFKQCQDKGIKLYTIFEDEWFNIPEKVVSLIAGQQRNRINARDTKFVEINVDLAKTFCKQNHIQRSAHNTSSAYGLLDSSNTLLSVMCFGKHHRQNNKIVMNRFCSLPDISVVGGASKLLKNGSRIIQQDIYSWSDNRYSLGDVYEKIGCIKDGEIAPDYCWTNYTQRISKQSRAKNVTKQPKELTEKQYNESLGLSRVWDCGKIRWLYKFEQ